MTLLTLRGLEVRAGATRLVAGVDLEVVAGEVTALVGPSGVGKSVTARACLGVVDVDPGIAAGELRLAVDPSRDWFAPRARRAVDAGLAPLRGRWMTHAPQGAASALNPGRTVGRQLLLALGRREDRVDPRRAIPALLREVGLDPGVAAALPGELSGGQCQRAALAVALAPSPRVLVADEPETGLDPLLRRQVVELLVRAAAERGLGVLLVTHHPDTVARVAHRVVRLGGEGTA